jgi:hypothetical protein
MSGSYFFANTNIIGKYGSKGVIIFVVESAIRKAACVVSGANPSIIIIGTNTGEITAHFADALVTNKLINIENSMKLNISQIPLNPISFKKLAPLTASTNPRFDQLKYARNCAAAKANTIYELIELIDSAKIFTSSFPDFNFFDVNPKTIPMIRKKIIISTIIL